jgi:hypothetical protein
MQKLIMSMLLLFASIAMFWLSYAMGVKMLLFPSDVVSTTGRSGQSSSQIWYLFSLVSFIVGLAILAFLKSFWKK